MGRAGYAAWGGWLLLIVAWLSLAKKCFALKFRFTLLFRVRSGTPSFFPRFFFAYQKEISLFHYVFVSRTL
jgi:hypothetical protein